MKLRNQIKCQDGFTMSIQASSYHYCRPRNDQGPYTHVEVGFPSQAEPLLMPYAEDKSDPTGTVYCCVPREVVEAVVLKHDSVALKELT